MKSALFYGSIRLIFLITSCSMEQMGTALFSYSTVKAFSAEIIKIRVVSKIGTRYFWGVLVFNFFLSCSSKSYNRGLKMNGIQSQQFLVQGVVCRLKKIIYSFLVPKGEFGHLSTQYKIPAKCESGQYYEGFRTIVHENFLEAKTYQFNCICSGLGLLYLLPNFLVSILYFGCAHVLPSGQIVSLRCYKQLI